MWMPSYILLHQNCLSHNACTKAPCSVAVIDPQSPYNDHQSKALISQPLHSKKQQPQQTKSHIIVAT